MTEREALKMALEALEISDEFVPVQEAITAIKEALAQPKFVLTGIDCSCGRKWRVVNNTLTATEQPEQEPVIGTKTWFEDGKVVTQHLTAKDIYKDPEQPEQRSDSEHLETVAHLWECLGRWSAYLVNNGTQAECAPPSWLCDAVKNATTPPQRTWVGLTHQERNEIRGRYWLAMSDAVFDDIEAKLKEKNT